MYYYTLFGGHLFNDIFPNRLSHESTSPSCRVFTWFACKRERFVYCAQLLSFSSCLRSCRCIYMHTTQYTYYIMIYIIIVLIAALCIMICKSCARRHIVLRKTLLHFCCFLTPYTLALSSYFNIIRFGTVRCPNARPRYQKRNITAVVQFDSKLDNMKYPYNYVMSPPFASQ